MDELRTWAPLAVSLIAIATAVWQVLTSPGRSAQADVDLLGGKVDAIDRRLSAVETSMKHMPDQDGMHRLEVALARLDGRIEVLDERLRPLAAIATRMQDHLMEVGR